jgi:predicted nucleotidyltransferase
MSVLFEVRIVVRVFMKNSDEQVLHDFADHIRQQYPTAGIWAFGSRTRGSAEADSDLDVCVVIDNLTEADDKAIMTIAWEIGFENDVIISTITFSREEFTAGPLSQSPIVLEIRRNGVAA